MLPSQGTLARRAGRLRQRTTLHDQGFHGSHLPSGPFRRKRLERLGSAGQGGTRRSIAGTRHGPTEVAISKIFFDIESIVVELDAERPVVPRGSCPLEKLVVGSYEQEDGI